MNQDPFEQLQEIRSLMERSSRFMSLSGWTGIWAGIYSLLGAALAYLLISNQPSADYETRVVNILSERSIGLLLIAASVILLSAGTALYQSSVKAKKQGVSLWNSTTKRLLIQTAIPLAVGGIFALVLLLHGQYGFIAPTLLIFYGLALLNGSKYTLKEFHSLALAEIGLGLISLFFMGYGLFFWTIGFGVLHIFYGILMQKRYQ